MQLMFPIIALGWVTNIFQRGAASMGRLNYILTRRAQHRGRAVARARAHGNGNGQRARGAAHCDAKASPMRNPRRNRIPAPDISHIPTARAQPSPVLRDINLHVPAGSTLAIVGPTGSGKSTLARSDRASLGSAGRIRC